MSDEEQPPPRPARPPVDDSAADTGTQVDRGVMEPPPEPSPEPPPPLPGPLSEPEPDPEPETPPAE